MHRIPIDLEGKTYFATLPSLQDLETFKDIASSRRRKQAFAAIPEGLPKERRQEFMNEISEDCERLTPLDGMVKLLDTPSGAAIVFHAHLRHENDVSVEYVTDLMNRAAQKAEEPALKAVVALRGAVEELWGIQKKSGRNGQPVQRQAKQKKASTSRRRTSR